jgi:hypothetical protein
MEQKDMNGFLFKNNKKTEDKHPDFNGYVNIHGAKFWLAGWKKQGKTQAFISLAVKPEEDQRPPDEFLDSIPQ